MENRVVITGMGIWSCLGKTLDEVRDALHAGKAASYSAGSARMRVSVPLCVLLWNGLT